MKRKKIFSIVLLLVISAVIVLIVERNASGKLSEQTKVVKVCVAQNFLPSGTVVGKDDIGTASVPEKVAKEFKMVTDEKVILGKALSTGAMPGTPIYMSQVSEKTAVSPGQVEICVPVNNATSCMVAGGDRVNVYAVKSNAGEIVPGELLAENIKVISSYDQSGKVISPTDDSGPSVRSRVPATVKLEISVNLAQTLSAYASKKYIYLTRR